MSSQAVGLEPGRIPLAPSTVRRAATGALWGVAVAGLVAPRAFNPTTAALLAGFSTAGALLALARALPAEALRRTGLAAAAAASGLAMVWRPEPTFFLLVPLLAGGAAWPFGTPPAPEKPLPRGAVPVLFVVAAAVLFLQAAHRHWTFGSGGMDLGLFYQTQWLIAHGLVPNNTLLGMHALGDHMTFDDYLLARLLAVHDGAETLLFAQSVAVASAVFPLYALGRRLLGRPRGALALPLLWLLSPDVHSGIMFDYNTTPLGSAGLLWVAWALACRGPVAVLVTSLLTCGAKENLCLYVAAMALVMGGRLCSWRRAACVAAFALGIFVVEMVVLFPRFQPGGFRHWKYEELGEGPREIFTTIATRPDRTAALLVDHPQKRRSLLLPLATTGYLMAPEPVSLLMQLPNWGERFLSTHRTRWWGYYYGMPAVATALVGLVMGWLRLQREGRAGPRLPAYLVVCALLVGLFPPYRTHDGDHRSMMYTLHRPYASSPEDADAQRAAVAFIGRDPRVKVAAQHHLLPHLAGRPFIVGLDRAMETDVVALQLNGGTWPQGRPAWRRQLQALWATGTFHVAFCRDQTVVLRRGGGQPVSCPSWERLVSSAPLPSDSSVNPARVHSAPQEVS